MNINQVIIIGRLVRAPESKTLPTGATVATFAVATSHSYTGKNGQKVDETEYHNIVVWGKQAEACAQWLQKGQEVAVNGRLKTRSWEGKEGGKQYRTEIIAESVQFGVRPKSSGSVAPAPAPAPEKNRDDEVRVEDIPF